MHRAVGLDSVSLPMGRWANCLIHPEIQFSTCQIGIALPYLTVASCEYDHNKGHINTYIDKMITHPHCHERETLHDLPWAVLCPDKEGKKTVAGIHLAHLEHLAILVTSQIVDRINSRVT